MVKSNVTGWRDDMTCGQEDIMMIGWRDDVTVQST